MKDFISSNQAGRFFNHLHNSRNSRLQMFQSSIATIKQKVTAPDGEFDKNDLYGWCTPGFRDSHVFDIKIFPYPLPDIVTNYTDGVYTYELNGLSAPYLFESSNRPKRNHPSVLENIINRYMQLFFLGIHPLGNEPTDIDSNLF